MNTHLKQLWAAMRLPEKLQKSYKFFCRGLDIRVAQVMEPIMRNTRLFTDTGKAAIYRVTGQFSEMV